MILDPLSEVAAREVKITVSQEFTKALKGNPSNIIGAIMWGNALAKAAKAYINNHTVDTFLDFHLALCDRIPTPIQSKAS